IIVNGRATLTVMTHAESPQDLVYGILFTERVVDSMDNIDSVIVEEPQVSVVTKHPYSILLSRKTVLAGCGGASSFLDSGKLGAIEHEISVSASVLKKSEDQVPESPWTSAGLFSKEGKLLRVADDVTAQNTVDILIGYALNEHLNLGETYVVLRGNCTAETMRKLIIAKIPAVMLLGQITDAATKLAKDTGLRIW
ncbi:MAG TPA: formate dehydrogenase accessory sulfurtransferase FdhD, partial [Methanocorpusculum sp.]|nr:formate dehydrogenase accessory sulfurtransferase FdhD [Methanocorpusculum sp.]